MLFHVLGILILIWLTVKTNSTFRAEGIQVGWMGAKASDLPA